MSLLNGSSLPWGIASAGRISHDFMVGLKALPKAEHSVVAVTQPVAARSLQSATAFATTHDIPTAYGSYEELAKDPQVQSQLVGVVKTCFNGYN